MCAAMRISICLIAHAASAPHINHTISFLYIHMHTLQSQAYTHAHEWCTILIDGRMLIDGRRVAAAAGETFACVSPIDGRHLADIARGREADIDAAVASARRAFDDGRWWARPPAARKEVLLRFRLACRRLDR